MSREQLRDAHRKIKKLSLSEFREEMSILHTRAYQLAEKHYQDAMFIILQPKQCQAVIDKVKQIREEWDHIEEKMVSLEDTRRVSNVL